MTKGKKMKHVWLIGAGPMAQDYIKVLDGLDVTFTVIGRSEETAKQCEEATGCSVLHGGLGEFLAQKPHHPSFVLNKQAQNQRPPGELSRNVSSAGQ